MNLALKAEVLLLLICSAAYADYVTIIYITLTEPLPYVFEGIMVKLYKSPKTLLASGTVNVTLIMLTLGATKPSWHAKLCQILEADISPR